MIFNIPFAWLALRSAYQHSEHVGTLLTLANLDAFAAYCWSQSNYTEREIEAHVYLAWIAP